MEFRYTTQLLDYMAEKGRNDIAVEVAASNHSDIEVTEIYIRLVSRKMLQQLRKKGYRIEETSIGKVALPPYRLHYAPVVTFGLKRRFIFTTITYDGIRL
jgi:hypothetical protein